MESDGSLIFNSNHWEKFIYIHTVGPECCFHSNRSFCQKKGGIKKWLHILKTFRVLCFFLSPQCLLTKASLFRSVRISSLLFSHSIKTITGICAERLLLDLISKSSS